MKAKELAERLMENPNYDVEFRWSYRFSRDPLTFIDICIDDIRDSDKAIVLDGELEEY